MDLTIEILKERIILDAPNYDRVQDVLNFQPPGGYRRDYRSVFTDQDLERMAVSEEILNWPAIARYEVWNLFTPTSTPE